ALHVRVAEGVVHDPLVDRPGLGDVTALALDDPLRGLEHEAVGRDELRRLRVLLEDRRILLDGTGRWLGEIDGTVARREAADDLEDRCLLAGRPLRIDEAGVVARITLQLRGRRVALPRVRLALEV